MEYERKVNETAHLQSHSGDARTWILAMIPQLVVACEMAWAWNVGRSELRFLWLQENVRIEGLRSLEGARLRVGAGTLT